MEFILNLFPPPPPSPFFFVFNSLLPYLLTCVFRFLLRLPIRTYRFLSFASYIRTYLKHELSIYFQSDGIWIRQVKDHARSINGKCSDGIKMQLHFHGSHYVYYTYTDYAIIATRINIKYFPRVIFAQSLTYRTRSV